MGQASACVTFKAVDPPEPAKTEDGEEVVLYGWMNFQIHVEGEGPGDPLEPVRSSSP